MKFAADRPPADPDAAARKLVEIANGVEAVQDVRQPLAVASEWLISTQTAGLRG
jgi:hypothetical protein